MWNGSAAFRAVIPALVSTGLVVVYSYYWKDLMKEMVDDTYTITVMIAFFWIFVNDPSQLFLYSLVGSSYNVSSTDFQVD